MLFKDKQGMSEDGLKNGIFAVIILIILIVLFGRITHFVPSASEDVQCQTYVRLASVLKDPITKENRLDLNKACPTLNAEIAAKGSVSETRNNNALDSVLEEMYHCGQRYGFAYNEFKYNPFNQWKTDNVCVVCTKLDFTGFEGSELNGLLSRSAVAQVPEGKTYFEFFRGDPPTEDDKTRLKDIDDGLIDTNEDYYIIYTINMRTSMSGFLTRLGIGGAAGALVGTAAASTTKGALYAFSAPFWIFKGRVITKAITGATKPLAALGFVAGLAGGAYAGSNVADESYVPDDDETYPMGAFLLFPTTAENIGDYCKTLGVDPLTDPWEGENI